MLRLKPWTLSLVFLVAQTGFCLAKAPERLALLIGNQNYSDAVGPLKNPHKDVDLIAASLKRLGFKVRVLKDASYRKMDIAIRRHVDLTRRAGDGAIGFFYYSGHGVANPETKRNFLVPVDVTRADDANIWYEAFQQDEIINRLVKDAGNATHYVIFDACRDELKLSGASVKALGDRKGFVPVAETSGILIAYATAPGRTASDAGKDSGPYASALAGELVRPGIEAVTMFRNVQLKVKQAIGQDPWLSFPALPAVYFAGKEKTRPKPIRPKSTGTTFSQQAELEYWNTAKASKDPALLQAYIDRYPNGTFTPLARILIDKLKMSREKQTLANIKQEELRAAEDKKRQAEAERMRAERKAALAKQSEELRKAREEARKAREALQRAEQERAKALAEAKEAQRVTELARQEAEQAANAKVAVLTKPAAASGSTAGQVQPGSGNIDRFELAKRVQTELKRVGCLSGRIDGLWGSGSRKSMTWFNQWAGLKLNVQIPTLEALRVLKGRKHAVCIATNVPLQEKSPVSSQVRQTTVKTPRRRTKNTGGQKRSNSKECLQWTLCAARVGPNVHAEQYCDTRPRGCY